MVNTCTVTGRADFSDRQAIRRVVAREPRGGGRRHRLLRPDRPGRGRGDPRGGPGRRQPGEPSRPAGPPRPGPEARAPARAGERRLPGTAAPDRPGRAIHAGLLAGLREDPGRLPAPLRLLHRAGRPRAGAGARSRKVVVEQVEALVDAGYAEVTLTGVDLGHYGWDLGPRTTLAALVRRLARGPRAPLAAPVLGAARLLHATSWSSWSPASAGSVAHLHLPLQSGSDRVLRADAAAVQHPDVPRARRAPGRGDPRSRARAPTSSWDHPGETDADFEATEALVEALPFSYLHVFPYSDRKGTEAARGPAPRVPPGTIRERSGPAPAPRRRRRARRSAGPWSAATRPVLVLEQRDRETGRLVGLTDNYVEVLFAGPGRAHARVLRESGSTGARTGAETGRSARQRWVRAASWASSGAAGSTSWRASTTSAGHRVRTPFGDPSDAYCIGRLGDRASIFLPRHGRGHRLIALASCNFRANIYGLKALGVRVGHLGQRGRQHEGGDPPARPRHPRPVLRPHEAARLLVLRRRHRGARRHGGAGVPRSRGRARGGRRESGRDASTGAAPTSASRARSSRPRPSRGSTGAGASTSSG